jgi:hypothetical protein
MPYLEKFESSAFVLLFVTLAYSLAALAPRTALTDVGRPETLAGIATALVAFVMLFLRVLPKRRPHIERAVYALFLTAMPMIYFAAAYMSGSRGDLALKLVGVLIFVGLAVLGYCKSYLALGFGIMAHGVVWDSWHHHSHPYVASWYPMTCLLVDLALGFLVITQAGVHQRPARAEG